MSYLCIVKLCNVKPGAGTCIIYEHAGYYWALCFQREVEQELMGREVGAIQKQKADHQEQIAEFRISKFMSNVIFNPSNTVTHHTVHREVTKASQ